MKYFKVEFDTEDSLLFTTIKSISVREYCEARNKGVMIGHNLYLDGYKYWMEE